MNTFNYIYSTILVCFCFIATAQNVPIPAKTQQQAVVIKNVTIHVGNGTVIENGQILFENGKLTQVAKTVNAPANAMAKDYSGKHAYPGIIAAHTKIGLTEVEALRQTRDFDEAGTLNPNVRAIVAYNTDSRVTPTLRSNGILMTQIAPEGGRISGTSSIVQLDAWNWEDAAYKTDDGIYLNWPQSIQYTGWWAEPGVFKKADGYDENIQELNDYFFEAKAYSERTNTTENLRFEGMEGLFNGQKKLYIRVNSAQDIITAVNFAKAHSLTPVIAGGSESYLVADFLKENNVSVMLNALHRTPSYDDEAVNLPYQIPSLLRDAGVKFCLAYFDYWQVRNLPYQAGTAVAHGLTKEEGLRSITLSVAEILGIDETTGSLEQGKDATLLITEGDLLDMHSSNIIDAYIQGRQINLGNKQKDLYKKFSDKYGHEVILP